MKEKRMRGSEKGTQLVRGFRLLLSVCLVFGMLIGTRVSVLAADMDILVKTTGSASVDDTVTAQVILSTNPGITTMGLSIGYDDSVLEYNGATWLSSVSSNGNNMLLASPVTESGDAKVNVSAVLNNTYTGTGEVFVTLNFRAKQAFTSMPITATARDISDANYNALSADIVIDRGTSSSDTETQTNTGTGSTETQTQTSATESQTGTTESQTGTTESQTGTTESQTSSTGTSESESEDDDSETETESETVIDGDDDDDDDDDDDGTTIDGDNGDSNTKGGSGSGGTSGGSSGGSGGSGGSGRSSGSSGSSGRKGLDSTFKTGATDPKVIFGGLAMLLVSGAGGSMAFLRRARL